MSARLDLHGLTQDQAFHALLSFAIRERTEGARSALVITGKGRNGMGVLRQRFLDWLHDPRLKSHISGFAPAHQKHGGAGAFYIFLRKPLG